MPTAEDIEAAGAAWDRATAGITGAADELAVFRDEFAQAIAAGGSLHDLEDALQDALAEREWTWPWFEEWYGRFTEWGVYPFNWPPLAPTPTSDPPPSAEDLVVYRRAAIAPLLAHTAAMIYFRDRHLSRVRPGIKWRLALRNDEAEKRVAAEKSPAIEAGDLSELPPFFPGDRTTLTTDTQLRASTSLKP
jgi:hypothetical protein